MPRKKCLAIISKSGERCHRYISHEATRYCTEHSAPMDIPLETYISVTENDRFWIFKSSISNWDIKSKISPVILSCPSTGIMYRITDSISGGAYGIVRAGTRLYDEKKVAIKIFTQPFIKRDDTPAMSFSFITEYHLHTIAQNIDRDSSFIVELIDAFFIRTVSGLFGCLVLEYMDGCIANFVEIFDNIDYLEYDKLILESLKLWAMTACFIVESVIELQKHDFFHLDIKSGNVLYKKIKKGGNVIFKLADFGLACSCYSSNKYLRCYATGTHLPIEWRKTSADKYTPTYETIYDKGILKYGVCYAICKTLYRILKHIPDDSLPRTSRDIRDLVRIGRDDSCSFSTRNSVSVELLQIEARRLLERIIKIIEGHQ
jgi:serine/threonine protein kinase